MALTLGAPCDALFALEQCSKEKILEPNAWCHRDLGAGDGRYPPLDRYQPLEGTPQIDLLNSPRTTARTSTAKAWRSPSMKTTQDLKFR